jgi:predicted transcriptional regulator
MPQWYHILLIIFSLVIVPTSGLFFFQEIAMLRAEARQRLEIRREQSQFLRNEVNNNREIEAHISVLTRSTVRLRDDYNKLLKTVDELTSEVSKFLYRHKFHTKVFLEITVFGYKHCVV